VWSTARRVPTVDTGIIIQRAPLYRDKSSSIGARVSGVNAKGNDCRVNGRVDAGVNGGVKISYYWGWYFCIWGCENELERPKEWENVVEGYVDGFCALGTVRFGGLLTF
jgi:hypothetical protein